MTEPEPGTAPEKTCSKCKETKSIDNFCRDASRRDGREARCRDCNAKRLYQHRAKNKEQTREQEARYRQANREKIAERDRRYRARNAEKISERRRRYREANRERIAEAKRKYAEKNRKNVRAYRQQYYRATRDLRLEHTRQRRLENLEREREQDRRYRARIKGIVFAYYGEECVCCGTITNLSIDHINGDGARHREALFGNSRSAPSTGFYRWIINNDFPDDLQVLCKPCNGSKGLGERCRLNHSSIGEVA